MPAALRERDRWVRHRDKRPLTVSGSIATSTDPSTWTTWDAARTSRIGDGAGFVLNGDGVVCIDLDDCLDGGRPKPWAEQLLAQMPKTYTEVSPSGSGLHVWGTGNVVKGRIVKVGGSGRLELYGRGRYMTVTGRRFRKSPARLADLGDFIASL